MKHTTKVIEVLQISDGIVSVCISCCGLHGEWRPCPNCGGADDPGCETCKKTAMEPHPHGGQFPVMRPGFVKDPDTRSWNTFHLVAHEETGARLRSVDELEQFIALNHTRIATQHEAALRAVAHTEGLKGVEVIHS